MEFYLGESLMNVDQFESDIAHAGSLYYTDLDTLETIPYGLDNATGTHFQMETLENPDILNWNGEDCITWALKVCSTLGIDQNTTSVANFVNVTGADLMNYSQYDFCTMLDCNVGSTFYEEFRDLLKKRGIVSSNNVPCSLAHNPESDIMIPDSQLTDLSLETPYDMESLERILLDPEFCQQFDDYQPKDFQDESLFFKTEEDSSSSNSDHLFHEVPYSPESQFSLSPSPLSPFSPSSPSPSLSPSPSPTPSSSLSSSGNILEKIKTTSRKRVRGPKNWEYLMRMLVDQQYNPSVIRWEDEAAHTFRIVKPSVIAQMWGNRSNKPNLTYDNFARGLRYHYTTGALEAVSVRQLVYRCGPKALKYLREQLHYDVGR